jgi:hypothetical protein
MKSYYYDALRDIYAEICKEEKHRPKFIKEYGGYRTTASGNRVDRDQPNKSLEDQQSDAIRRNQMIRDKKSALLKLKSKGAVPTKKDGTPLKTFEEFRRDALNPLKVQLTKKNEEYLKQVYNSANALEYDKFVLFVSEML